jgi:hypothetical protein
MRRMTPIERDRNAGCSIAAHQYFIREKKFLNLYIGYRVKWHCLRYCRESRNSRAEINYYHEEVRDIPCG